MNIKYLYQSKALDKDDSLLIEMLFVHKYKVHLWQASSVQ